MFLTGGAGPVGPNLVQLDIMPKGIGFDLVPVVDIDFAQSIFGQELANQIPAGLATPMQIKFGPPQVGPAGSVELLADGTVNFLQSGVYNTTVNLYFARQGQAGISLTFLYALVNGVQYDNPVAIEMTDSGTTRFYQFQFGGRIPAGTEIKYFIVRDSAFANDGFLPTFTSTDGYGNSPSAVLRVNSFT